MQRLLDDPFFFGVELWLVSSSPVRIQEEGRREKGRIQEEIDVKVELSK